MVFEWTTRGTLIAFSIWLVLLAVGVALYLAGHREGALAVATVGFFLAPFLMVLGGRSR